MTNEIDDEQQRIGFMVIYILAGEEKIRFDTNGFFVFG